MMRRIFVLLFCVAVAGYGCTNKPGHTAHGAAGSAPQKPAKQPQINLSEPEQVDTSAYVLFPLRNRNDDSRSVREEISDYASSAPVANADYWNIIFYNTATQQYHLLDSSRRMLIRGYSNAQTGTDGNMRPGEAATGAYLFYVVVTRDINHNGVYDARDPDYLFVSDKTGHHFKQISPEGYAVQSWRLIAQTGKVLMMTQKAGDDVKNHKIIPFEYNLATGQPARRVFGDAFLKQTEALLQRQWPVKE